MLIVEIVLAVDSNYFLYIPLLPLYHCTKCTLLHVKLIVLAVDSMSSFDYVKSLS